MLENLFLIDNVRIKLDSKILIFFIIGLLVKDKFCNVLGYFISKVIWMDLLDFDIFNWFVWICRNIFYYYSGFLKKKNLYWIKYIFCFCCVKILVCKCKSIVCIFLKRLGFGLLEEFFMGED